MRFCRSNDVGVKMFKSYHIFVISHINLWVDLIAIFLWKLEALRGLGVFLGSEGGLSGVPEEPSPKSHLPCGKGWIWDSLLLEHPKKKAMCDEMSHDESSAKCPLFPGPYADAWDEACDQLSFSEDFPKSCTVETIEKTLTSKAWHSHTVGRVLDRQNKTWG